MDSLAHFSNDQLLTSFCLIDDLAMILFPSHTTLGRPRDISFSEAATFCIIKSKYGIPSLRQLYQLISERFTSEYHLPSYKSFVEAMNTYAPQLLIFIQILLQIKHRQAGTIKLMDSTCIPVCKNIRINSHKVMKQIATRSKSTMGWYYGLKLHAVSDDTGNPIWFIFTTANVDDRKVLNQFLDLITDSIVVADAGYLSPKLENKALDRGNILITGTRKNMKKVTTPLHIFLLNMRIKIEHIFSVLKERYGLITSLPRSQNGYLAHYVRVIFGYLFVPAIS